MRPTAALGASLARKKRRTAPLGLPIDAAQRDGRRIRLNRRKLNGFAIPGRRLVRTFGGGARPRRAD
jgi:hypothetical protein